MASINIKTRKFLFFDEVEENTDKNNINKINKIEEKIEEDKDKEKIKEKKLNISISSLVPIVGMQCIDEVIFLCANVFYKETKIKNNRMLKIYNNRVIDEYIMFNKYIDFQLIKLQDNPILIVFGSMRKIVENLKEITSIKFYKAANFIENKESRYAVKEKINDVSENYPELLLREIKFYKKGNNILCETEGKVEDLPSLENCTSSIIDDYLNYAAIGLNKKNILILSAFPNLLDCKGKKIKTIILSPPEKDGIPVEITNIKFGELNQEEEDETKVLYVSTKNYLAYYEWIYDDRGGDDLDNNIQCKFINNIPGVSPNCLYSYGNLLLVATNDDKYIYEFKNLKVTTLNKEEKKDRLNLNGELAFEGQKNNLMYFKNDSNYYIIYQVEGKAFSIIQIFDNMNNFFVFIKTYNQKILSICQDGKYIYLFVEENQSKKYIVKLAEKDNKKKFDILFKKKLFDIALDYAKYLGYDENKLAEINKYKGEYEYSRGEFDKSIEAYKQTINYLDPSIVIQKFLSKSKMEFLIKYLEEIESNITFKQRSFENYTNYTTLLLNCYLMKEEITKLKEFIDKRGNISPEILKTAIDVCLDTQNIDLALDIALSKEMYEDYLQILILKQNKYKEALDFIFTDAEKEPKSKKLEIKEQIKLFCKFGENFLKSISDVFFNRVKLYMQINKEQLTKEEKKKLFAIFVSNDTFYKKIFEMLDSYEIELDKNMLHRRLELYLEDKEYDKIIEILQKKEFIGKYDNEYLMMLFKHKNFLDGIETLSQLTEQRFELLSIYIKKKEYDKIINLCKTYGESEKAFWGLALNFFVDPNVRINLDEKETENINKYLQIFLDTILEKNSMLSVNVLDIINEKNDKIPLRILRKFIDASLEKELDPLNKKVESFEENNSQLKSVNDKIKEIQTQATSFKLSKCEACFMGITFPAICFRCGHCYHTMCLNTNDENDFDDAECPKCAENKEALKDRILFSKSIYDSINSKEKLDEVLNNCKNKFEYVHELYGKGIINLGPVDEDFYNNTNAINEALNIVGDGI